MNEDEELNNDIINDEASDPKKISKVKLSGETYEIYSRLASALDPNGGYVVSSIEDLKTLSGADLSGKVLNGSALFDVVSALEEKIKQAQEGAVLSNDIFTTTSVGYIEKGKTITAGTPLEDLWTSALNKYVKPSVSVTISPSTTLYAYPTTATITGITAAVTNGTMDVNSVAFIESTNTKNVTDIKGFETKGNVTSSVNITANDNMTFNVTASDGKESVTASKSIAFVWPYFHGVSKSITPDLDNKEISKSGDKTYEYAPTGYYYIAYDSSYSDLTSIKDNGGNGDETITNWEKKTTAYEGHEYKMYITKEQKAAAGKFKFV